MSELIYGRRAVQETLRAARRRFYRLWLEADAGAKPTTSLQEIIQMAEAAKVPSRQIKGGLFEKLSTQQSNHQGVALEVSDYPYVEADEILAYSRSLQEPPLLLILDHIQDPQNLGTLIRTAEVMGVHGIFIPDRRAAGITPAVSNASAGAVEHIRTAQVTNINRLIEEFKEENIWVVGLDGQPDVPELNPTDLRGALAVVVGSEGAGLSRLTRERCDFLARLPMYGQVESLNAAVTGSIVLYLARRMRAVPQVE
jgi:23S rRNA (guanosine2251-2'-O)-methyltransferase